MSKLLSDKLKMESVFKFNSKPGPGSYTGRAHRQYVCRKCACTFRGYKGVPQYGNGIGLCQEHNPNYKPEDQHP